MWETISFVNRSRIRKLVLYSLAKPDTPPKIAKRLDLNRPVVSNALLSLTNKGLVVCLNPASRKERYYQVTKKGETIKKDIEKMDI
jgi:predicted transcriptional regulator